MFELCRKHIKNPAGSFPIIWHNDKQEQLLLSCGNIKLQQSSFVHIVDNINQTCIANCEVFWFFYSAEVVDGTWDRVNTMGLFWFESKIILTFIVLMKYFLLSAVMFVVSINMLN